MLSGIEIFNFFVSDHLKGSTVHLSVCSVDEAHY